AIKPRQPAKRRLPAAPSGNSPVDDGREARHAEIAAGAETTAAIVVTEFSKLSLGNVSVEETVDVLLEKAKAVQRGDLRDAEALLTAQAIGLNSIFTACVTVARVNLTKRFDVAERLMRLGLKAQGQSRA